MSRIIKIDDPYKVSMSTKFDDMVLNNKPMKKEPVFMPFKKGIEVK
jgi:hypothetical protein